MVKKKDLVIVALATFCLTATLFLTIPTRSQTPSDTLYDPWIDNNHDGQINILDAIRLSNIFLTSGDPTANVNVTNWPTWLVNQSASLVKEMPLCRIYSFNVTSTSYTTALNVTPPIGKTWYISEIMLKTTIGDGMITLKTKGVIQFSDMYEGTINALFDSVKFPAIIKFTDTESIIVEAKVFVGYPYMYGFFQVIGWEE